MALLLSFCILALGSVSTLAQSQTTGRIAGTVKDQNGAVIAGAAVTLVSRATRDERKVTTDKEGNYAVPLLSPGTYHVSIKASGFKTAHLDNTTVVITETTSFNADLAVGGVIQESVTVSAAPFIQTAGPQLGRVVVRGGYGNFYSRASNLCLFTTVQLAPYYVTGRRSRPPSFADPFLAAPSLDRFPTFVEGIALANHVFDRDIRTPYLHQYNTSVQYAMGTDLLLEVAYAGTRGLNLFRVVGFYQARLASPQHPVVNEVTGQVITTNTPSNARLRAPFQGVATNAPSGLNQTTGQSTYNSLQMSLTRRFSHGLQFLATYTYAKSIDNTASGSGSGTANEVAFIAGNQLDNRANRGVSNFDRTHRFVLSYLWDLPEPAFATRSTAGRWLLSNWQVAGIIVAMSGLPIDIVDTSAGSLYGLADGNSPLARPNWTPGATRRTATSDVPPGISSIRSLLPNLSYRSISRSRETSDAVYAQQLIFRY
jgi:Carboxypeptidase regulatory-like domain